MTRLTREMETRSNQMLPAYAMAFQDQLGIPYGVKRDGYVCYWAAYATRGEPTYQVDDMAAWGWSLVPADRAKTVTRDLLNNNPLSGKYICRKDVILMEAPEEIAKAYRDHQHKMNTDTIRSMTHVTYDDIRQSRY